MPRGVPRAVNQNNLMVARAAAILATQFGEDSTTWKDVQAIPTASSWGIWFTTESSEVLCPNGEISVNEKGRLISFDKDMNYEVKDWTGRASCPAPPAVR